MADPSPLPPPIGWPLLPLPDSDGRIRYPTLEQGVRQSIEVILRTQPGEQLMRPEFGAGLARFLHEPNTLTTRSRIHDAITTALGRWEPRVLLDRVDVAADADQPSRVRVEIAYRIKRTGVPQAVRLTLQMES